MTDLVKFLPERTMADVTASLRAETTNAPTRDAAIDGTVPSLAGRGLIESVSDITGLAVVAAHEQRHARREGEGAGGGSRGTALARRLASGLRKMEKQLEARTRRSAAREKTRTRFERMSSWTTWRRFVRCARRSRPNPRA